MFYNSRKRVYNMGVKSERNLNSSRADDLNQLIIFPPYHIVNPRDASLGDLLFFVFVTALAFLCLSDFSLDLQFYCGFFVDLSVFLRLFSAAYRFFCTDFSISSQNSVFSCRPRLYCVSSAFRTAFFLLTLFFTPLFRATRGRSSAGMLKN